jgi:hypothetical protein
MLYTLMKYVADKYEQKRRELVVNADKPAEDRMDDFDRGWTSGYCAAMRHLETEIRRLQAEQQVAGQRYWHCRSCRCLNVPENVECFQCHKPRFLRPVAPADAWTCADCGNHNPAGAFYCDCCGNDF